jgi:HAD superfamily hydrolase (TIGR01509 family)
VIKAVIFDMDGLLVDSEPFWQQAHIAVVGQEGHVLTENDVRQMAGRGTSSVVRLWQERFGWPDAKNSAITAAIVAKVTDLARNDAEAKPGVYQLISLLHEHTIPMAVASSSAQSLIDVIIAKLHILHDMQVVHSAESELRSKPYPDVFLTTAQLLNVSPADCLVFEDSANGVKAAVAAGMNCIAVPENPYDKALFTQADLIVHSLEDIHWELLTSL